MAVGAGSLTIVGLGPAGPQQATLEAAEELRGGAARGALAYGLGHAREVALRGRERPPRPAA